MSNKTRAICIILVSCLVFNLAGCWSRNELTELAIVSGMGIDLVDNEYILTVQVLNPGEIAGSSLSSRLPITSYESKGRSIFEAIRKLSKQAAKRLYFAHLRLVVISEDAAKTGIGRMLELMSRDHEFRTDFYPVIAKGEKASKTLKILTAIEKNPANKIFTTLDVSHSYWAATLGTNLDDIISEMTLHGDNAVLAGILLEGNPEIGNRLDNVEMIQSAASINIDHLAIFKGDKLIGWLNEDESKGHNYLTDNVDSTVVVVDWKDGTITFEVRDTKSMVKATIKDNEPQILVTLSTEVNVGEVQAKVDLLNEETIKELEEEISRNQKEKIMGAIEKAKEMQSDIFGFGELIHRKDPKLWKSIKENWNEEGFVNVDVELEATTSIRRLGTTNEPFLNEIQGGS